MNNIKIKILRVLKWSEKYTKTDMVYVGKSSFWLMSNQIFTALTALFLSILFANLLPKEMFGMYKYILSMVGIAAAFSLTGINTAVVRAVAKGFDNILKPALVAQFWWSIPRLIVGLSFSLYYFYQDHFIYGLAFLFVAFLAPLASISNTYAPFLEGKKQFDREALYGVIANIIHVTSLAFVCIFYPSVVFLVIAYFLSSSITGAWFLWRILKKNKISDETVSAENITYAKELSFLNIVGVIATQVDSILIYHLLGPVQLAIFSFSTIIPERIRSMFGVIASIALPRFSENNAETGKTNILEKVLRILLLAFFLIIAYTITAPLIFEILFPEYLDSIQYSQVYAFSLLIIAAHIPVSKILAEKNEKSLYILNIISPVFKIVSTFFAIVFMGIWGAVLAKILHYLFYLILSIYLSMYVKD